MNDPENISVPPPPTSDTEQSPTESNPTGKVADNKPTKEKKSKKSETNPKTSANDIYGMIQEAYVVDERLIDGVFEVIGSMEDSVPLVATLLRDFMDGVKRPVRKHFQQFNVPGRLFDKLCQDLGMPSLGSAWSSIGHDAGAEIMGLLKEYVPPDREAADRFLKDRSMLPLSILIYRGFRNDETELGSILREWVAAVASGCEDQRKDIQKQAQQTAKWLMDLSSRKSNSKQFLATVAPVRVSLQLGKHAFDQVSRLDGQIALLDAEIASKQGEINRLSKLSVELDSAVTDQTTQLSESVARIELLEKKLSFGSAHAGFSESQAVGALRQNLKNAITSRTEDARLLLDRPNPAIADVLELLAEIDKQFH